MPRLLKLMTGFGHAAPRGSTPHADEVVSCVTHVPAGLLAQREGSVALRQRLSEPYFVLPRRTPDGPVPSEEGGGGAVLRVSIHDSPNVCGYGAKCPEDFHVRPLTKLQYYSAHLFAARQACHSGKSQTSTKGPCSKLARVGRKLFHPRQHAVPELVHRARRLIAAALAGRLLVTAWTSTTLNPTYMTYDYGKEKPTNDARCEETVW